MGSKGKKRRGFRPAPRQRPRPQALQQQAEQLQAMMLETQEALGEETVTATAGGGAVTVVMTGQQQVQSISIAPEVVDPEDVEMLEDLVMAAVNEALARSQELAASKMSQLTGGLRIPGLM